MWWLVTLLVLALIAFFIVKMMKSKTLEQQSQHEQSQQERLANAEAAHQASAKNTPPSDSTLTSGSAEVSGLAGVASGAAVAATAVGSNLSSGDTLADVREMIKILNLDRPDAGRLQISSEQLMAIRQGQTDKLPDADTVNMIAKKLRNMLA